MSEKKSGGGLLGWALGAAGSAVNYVSSAVGLDELETTNAGPDGADDGVVVSTDGHDEERKALWPMLKEYLGKDIMSVLSIPVWLMEPLSTLQKMAEIMEYAELLDKAAAEEDAEERLALVTAFALGCYAANERTFKPFNPVLGETYECEPKPGVVYVAEQVSHHPPVAAAHAHSDKWRYALTSAVKTKFNGNSIDVFPIGRTDIMLVLPSGEEETYNITPPQSRVHNLVVGRTWVDTFGELRVDCISSGSFCSLDCKPCGWFGKERYEVEGYVCNKAEEPQLYVSGKWGGVSPSGSLVTQRCDAEGEPKAGLDPRSVWAATPKPEGDKYGFTKFAHFLNSFESAPSSGVLASDARRRPDRVALEQGDLAAAGAAKRDVEERQRAERRKREGATGEWTPRYFRHKPIPQSEREVLETDLWEFDAAAFDQRPSPPDSAAAFSPWQFDEADLA
eukprot:CAMPEP_0170144230 /NCGR_PEP_ID=MMETSP0033_2-20121228/13371_1 /TAXON_ID=195969 /ORGANISM="Dolichomastix tenuilepis, Strain CCMP3274" /LENGTH=450 /DNA_ID=CAMNT_0010380719 /DNA_START=58 /DNA_END=1410 /DNA_ORIENTATION=+